ncbi:site-specific DNA-methyltransferase [Heliobacterium chlorum]|uniref:Methyltransferase n=1 Tax=Heliobacterium chlorum TaxID=2698 RepID=A0ABR7T724_HELCL|nr:site-specific DNA-methyltransferase [Heliobacterium chlorum]MBC9786560.1 site-specific DNA-methyltransferase [Heliobacterium chlorum]
MTSNIGELSVDRIYNMDINVGLKLLPNNGIDLIIADPPYGINYRSGSRKRKFTAIQNDNIIMADWLADAYRVLKDGGALYCYTRWDVYAEWYHRISRHFTIKNCIVWQKNGGGMGDLRGAYSPAHEFLIFAVKGRHLLNGKRISDVWAVPRDPAVTYIHPTQKPVKLAEMIIEKSSQPGDVVLVPFCGSGGDCVAVKQMGRRFLAFDVEEQYVVLAKKRLVDVA